MTQEYDNRYTPPEWLTERVSELLSDEWEYAASSKRKNDDHKCQIIRHVWKKETDSKEEYDEHRSFLVRHRR